MVVQARLMGVINVPMRLILGLPFATPLSRQLMLLHLTGRKSGKRYVQPVSYVPDGSTLLTPGGGRWKLNLKPSECVRLRLRGRDVLARPALAGRWRPRSRNPNLLKRHMEYARRPLTRMATASGSINGRRPRGRSRRARRLTVSASPSERFAVVVVSPAT